MGDGGITYGGEVVQNAPTGDDATRGIEIPFEDENFLVKATSKNPPSIYDHVTSTLGNLAKGAYSWPFDYTLCIHWIAGNAGLYGPRVQQTCQYHADRVLSLVEAALRISYYFIFRGVLWRIAGSETMRSMVADSLDSEGRAALQREIANRLPEIQGRVEQATGRWVSGSFFGRWMDSRIKGRGGGRVESGVLVATNFLMLLWGSAIHASIKHPGNFGVIEIFVAWINGDAEYQVDSDTYRAIFQMAQEMSEHLSAENLGEDYDLYLTVLREVMGFAQAGGAAR